MTRVRLDGSTCEFLCPGCGQLHVMPIKPGPHPSWVFTGDADMPTLAPSIAAKGVLCVFDEAGEWTGAWQRDDKGDAVPFTCHSFLRKGHLEFLSDCTHALAGKIVELPMGAYK